MLKIVMVRHGESIFNSENRFSGWTETELSEMGIREARDTGKLLKKNGFTFDIVFTSLYKRAIRTANIILEEMDLMWIPVHKSWHLNQKHYGILQGLTKAEA
nr:2,3-bisphosphoglycerate-dependent phosphoglycerate mutase [Candidatus Sigynarchaeota archaeon]